MIKINGLGLLRGTKQLLEDADAVVYPGHKVGLIGANGCGKSSLFALLQGNLHADTGHCDVPQGWRVVSVAQETPSTDKPALEYVIDGDRYFRSLQQGLRDAEAEQNGEKIADFHGKLADAGAYDIESRASTILAGLGFAQNALRNPVSAFSGGWRMRLNLAQALLCQSDLLLLDEPTNHLDLDAVIWLEKWLSRYQGTLLLISHDKSFLDSTVTEIVSVEHSKLVSYTGNYSAYEKQRAERIRLQSIEYDKQQDKIAHLESFIRRFKAKASKAKQAQSRVKQLEKMETLLPAHAQSPFSFSFLTPPKLPNPLVHMEDVQIGYDATVILDKVHLNLVPGSRIGLLGRNGAGKSTLIKLLAAEKQPMEGVYQTSSGLQIGYFAQHQLETLRPDDTPLAHVQRLDKQATEQQLRDYLGGFGFHGDTALAPVAPMSGGEKARLVLALIVYQKPNLLLLDEPTNHLDLEMRHALNIALQSFEGAMVLVSHDRFLLTSVCDTFYLVDSGQVQAFSGDLEDYRDWLLSDKNEPEPETGDISAPKVDRKAQKRLEAEFRQSTSGLRKTLQRLEKQLDTLHAKQHTLEEALADGEIYEEHNKDKLKTCLAEQAELQSSLDHVEGQWMEAQEDLERMQQAFEASIAS